MEKKYHLDIFLTFTLLHDLKNTGRYPTTYQQSKE